MNQTTHTIADCRKPRAAIARAEKGEKSEPDNYCANFNTDLTLWQNKRQSLLECPNHGALLEVKDGHVCDGLQVLARFPSDDKAKATLRLAGFLETIRGFKAVPR